MINADGICTFIHIRIGRYACWKKCRSRIIRYYQADIPTYNKYVKYIIYFFISPTDDTAEPPLLRFYADGEVAQLCVPIRTRETRPDSEPVGIRSKFENPKTNLQHAFHFRTYIVWKPTSSKHSFYFCRQFPENYPPVPMRSASVNLLTARRALWKTVLHSIRAYPVQCRGRSRYWRGGSNTGRQLRPSDLTGSGHRRRPSPARRPQLPAWRHPA